MMGENPAVAAMLRRWDAIEQEYGEPLREVIRGGSMKVFVSPHAVRAYQMRVRALSPSEAEREIRDALQWPLFHLPSADRNLTIWGAYNRAGFPVCIATDPADEGAEFLLVRTCGPFWFWHEARHEWERIRGHKARRRAYHDRLPGSGTIR